MTLSLSQLKATRKDLLLSKVLHHTKRGWPDQVSDAMKPFLSGQHELSVEDDCLLWGMRVVIPKVLQAQMLKEFHRDYPGTTRMKVLARAHFWWPGLHGQAHRRTCQILSAMPVRETSTSSCFVAPLDVAFQALDMSAC